MYVKLENGMVSFLKAAYTEGNKLCLIVHDHKLVTKEYNSEEIVRIKMSNLESHISNRIELIDLLHL